MAQNFRSTVFIVIGIIAIGLAIGCYSIDDLHYESINIYGGDAFTGIQNAAAVTSRNVKELASIVQFGFGSVLLVMGLTLVGVGLIPLIGARQDETELAPETTEATSSIDTKTETLIQNAINVALKGRTSFMIAHRLSTVVNADLILVMNKGQIVESGKHHDLLLKKGYYFELYKTQFEQEAINHLLN